MTGVQQYNIEAVRPHPVWAETVLGEFPGCWLPRIAFVLPGRAHFIYVVWMKKGLCEEIGGAPAIEYEPYYEPLEHY